ncbi:MAG: hypothetical protein ABI891_08880 [Acidobacteriota bacterium]
MRRAVFTENSVRVVSFAAEPQQKFRAKVIAVATGRNQTTEKLSACNPDLILDNLKDASEVLELLKTI